MLEFRVHRDCDGHALRLRKIVIELFADGKLLDRRRMFGVLNSPLFALRLARKQKRMLAVGKKMLQASGPVQGS